VLWNCPAAIREREFAKPARPCDAPFYSQATGVGKRGCAAVLARSAGDPEFSSARHQARSHYLTMSAATHQ